MNPLLIIGSAPCTADDLDALLAIRADIPVNIDFDVCLIGLDSVDKCLWPAQYFATYHPADIDPARERRKASGGNIDYKVIAHDPTNPHGEPYKVDIVIPYKSPSGSSALLGVLAGVRLGYTRIILCGCPLANEDRNGKQKRYENFRKGWLPGEGKNFNDWQAHFDEYVGKVRSMSGWTKEFLGAPEDGWLNDQG